MSYVKLTAAEQDPEIRLWTPSPRSPSPKSTQLGRNQVGIAAAPTRMPFILIWDVAKPSSLRGLGPNFLILTHFLFAKTEGRTYEMLCLHRGWPHKAPENQECLTADQDLQSQRYIKYTVNTKTLLLWF